MPGHHPLAGRRPLELRQGAEDRKQQLAVRRGGIHLLAQRAKRDTALLEILDDGEEVHQRAAESVELPDDEAVSRTQDAEALLQADALSWWRCRVGQLFQHFTCLGISAGGIRESIVGTR